MFITIEVICPAILNTNTLKINQLNEKNIYFYTLIPVNEKAIYFF